MKMIVIVKWRNEQLNVGIELSEPVSRFKIQLYSITGVQPERQKIVDDADWSTVGLKEGQKVLMIGTVDEILKVPENGPVFEDSPVVERVPSVGQSAGLFNLGNSSFWNSMVQFLHSVPELKFALLRFSLSRADHDEDPHLLAYALKNLHLELDKSDKPVAPKESLTIFLRMNPRFTQTHNGTCMEQDLLQCWVQLLKQLTEPLKSQSSSGSVNIIKELFLLDCVKRVHCERCNKEDWGSGFLSYLCCRAEEVNTLEDGIRSDICSWDEYICSCSGSEEVHWDTSTIKCFPRYIAVYIQRFGDEEQEWMVKILRKVDLSLNLDFSEMCSEDFQKLHPYKELYDLVAVLTHKGTTITMGHYTAWIKQDSGIWIQYDDDRLIPKQEECVLELCGGGHAYSEMAFLCFYRARS